MEFVMIISLFLNILVNVFLLVASAKLCNFSVKRRKLLFAVLLNVVFVFGTILIKQYSVVCNLFWVLLLLILAGNTFGFGKDSVIPGAIFISMSILYDIAISGLIEQKIWSLLLLAVCVLFVLFRGRSRDCNRFVPVEIKHRGVKNSFTALHDTGNLLRDPVTGNSVLIVAGDIAQQLTGLTRQQLLNPVDTIQKRAIPGLQLLPYSTIGQPHGLLLAMRFRDIKIGQKRGSGLVAFAPDTFFSDCKYQALTGGNMSC